MFEMLEVEKTKGIFCIVPIVAIKICICRRYIIVVFYNQCFYSSSSFFPVVVISDFVMQ